jgi:phosphatidate cytidylyltransferase
MLTRWLSALIGIPLFLGLCLLGREPFGVAVFLLAGLALYELSTAWRRAGVHANLLIMALGLVLPLYAWTNWLDNGAGVSVSQSARVESVLFATGGALLIAAVAEVLRAERTGEMVVARSLGYGLLGAVYLSLFSAIAWLRAETTEVSAGMFPRIDVGVARTLITVFCVWATDSFALFAGKAFGKHKLAPHLSPGKTWEGSLGGFAAAVAFGSLFGMLFLGKPAVGAAIGALAGSLGQIGDLFKSSLKREVGIKDFGALIPGHGGALDRFDSLLFVAPVACLYFSVWG